MTAMEQIKEIEDFVNAGPEALKNLPEPLKFLVPKANEDIDRYAFLLRAFKVMREVAVDQSINPLAHGHSEQAGQAVVDGEFEKWMLLNDDEFEKWRSG